MTVNNIFSLFAWLIRIILGSKEKFEYLLIHHQGQVCILMHCKLNSSHERNCNAQFFHKKYLFLIEKKKLSIAINS